MNTIRTADSSDNPVSRRRFLKQGTLAVGGLSLAASSALAVDTAPKKIRIGIVGGGFGCSFQWHEHPDCVVEAVSDLRPERRAALMRTYKCAKAYPSLEKLVLDKNIDAVAVFTEAPNHVRHTVEAMKHGKHVIAAVPACFATLEEADELLDIVHKSGRTYMMAETSYYQQHTISARKFYEAGSFGEIFYCESEYQHDGLEYLYNEPYGDPTAKRTWRHGLAPMHYPTHCTAHLVGVTGERLTQVVCHGWGDDSPACTDNVYGNPFWNACAMFRTDKGHAFRVNVWWKGAHRGCERAQWIGTKMSFYTAHPHGLGPVIVRSGKQTETDDAGFVRSLPNFEKYDQPQWWKTDMLPEPLRHDTGHEGSHSFLTHEFIDALTHNRRPTVDVYEALAYTVPGIVAHQSALKGGEQLPIRQYERPS
ncbi:MAG TPA: Gfo/Idh/MocA family oxidoreductase [Anaerohalosphaeraceae bacterium]|jgi:predicted dehydrogenase|nr:Gfo/Idh/MocA family oxidoreductase [Anaerohalosphaeraceae bacterium]HRT51404.1 Gfo/Idh/MocA family oxidoreductase [Anaerohalosphaeraceae bacterium]HRT87281.1 Gfo/Idh/MocA family oxidoreductase [Anaerohalosphaeraceae bacterium]